MRGHGICFTTTPWCAPKVLYQNLEPWHVRVDVVKWDPELHTSAWRGAFDRRGNLQNKGLQCLIKNMCEESKASICYNGARMSEREREAHACCRVLSVWAGRVNEFDGTCIYSSWARMLILVYKGYCSPVYNSRLIDNSQELRENVRGKYLNYR